MTLNPETPGGAFDAFLPTAIARAAAQRPWEPSDGPLPALYLSHGAPPVYDDAHWMSMLFEWAMALPKPRAILMVSAHWEDAPLAITSATPTELVYDFGGFPPRYYQMRYDTPEASELARDVTAIFSDVTFHAGSRGLDHGAWVPASVMYPLADVPVLQLSMPTQRPQTLLEIGERLRPLRDSGVLIIGSGHVTHGLPFLTRQNWLGGEIPAWSSEFDQWATDALMRGDVGELLEFKTRAPGMPYAHPTPDHFNPLFVALGATDQLNPVTTVTGYFAGLSRRSFQLS